MWNSLDRVPKDDNSAVSCDAVAPRRLHRKQRLPNMQMTHPGGSGVCNHAAHTAMAARTKLSLVHWVRKSQLRIAPSALFLRELLKAARLLCVLHAYNVLEITI